MATSASEDPDPQNDPCEFYSRINGFLLYYSKMCRQNKETVNEEFQNILSQHNISNDTWHQLSIERITDLLKAGIEFKPIKNNDFIKSLVMCGTFMKNRVDANQGLDNMHATDVQKELMPKIMFLLPYFEHVSAVAQQTFVIGDRQIYFNLY